MAKGKTPKPESELAPTAIWLRGFRRKNLEVQEQRERKIPLHQYRAVGMDPDGTVDLSCRCGHMAYFECYDEILYQIPEGWRANGNRR